MLFILDSVNPGPRTSHFLNAEQYLLITSTIRSAGWWKARDDTLFGKPWLQICRAYDALF